MRRCTDSFASLLAVGRYAEGIRMEYSHLDATTFAVKRQVALAKIGKAKRLYHVTSINQELEARARSNMRREAEQLEYLISR